MSSFEKAAIIGYWRQGATFEEISALTVWSVGAIRLTINAYLKQQKQ